MDFGSISKGNMKRKQSSSLLAALGKPGQRSGGLYNAPPSSYAAPSSSYSPSLASSDESHENPGYSQFTEGSSSRTAASSIHHGHPGASRSVSSSTTASQASMYGRSQSGNVTPRAIRRVEDVYHLARDRIFQWSYLMQWYNGDVPWLNSIHIARSALESTMGAKMVDTKARQEYALGLSLAALFDITGAPDFLRGLNTLMDEWDSWSEQAASKGTVVGPIRNFFRPQRTKPRPSAAKDTATAEVTIAAIDASSESFLVLAVMPFTPDYFQVHASTASIIRDVYKKLLAMVLPSTRAIKRDDHAAGTLLHPSTFVHGVDSNGSVDLASDATLLSDVPSGSTLVGEGQKLTPAVIEVLLKVDSKLKKHYSSLVRDGDMIARKVLDDELSALSTSVIQSTITRMGTGWETSAA